MGPEDRPEREPSEDELREEDVSAGDRLDDRVAEGEGLPRHAEPDDILPPADAPEPDLDAPGS